MNIVTLHRDAERHAFFASVPARPIVFEKAIDCWFATDPEDAQTLLRSNDLKVVDYQPIYEHLEARSGCNFENLRFAFDHMPLCANGTKHAVSRRRLAEFLNARRTHLARVIPDIVARRLRPLRQRDEADWMADFLVPLVTDLIGAVTQTDVTDEQAIRRATIVFDRYIGLRKRIALDDEIGRIRGMVRRTHPDASAEEEGLRVALFILGHDTLTGTLGESLFRILDANRGRGLHEINFPALPNETAVPFVERVVGNQFEYKGTTFRKGERMRISLQPLVYSDDPADRARLFGIGAHACLGRLLALDVWKHLTAGLSAMEGRAEIVSHTMRTEDFVFTVPQTLIVRMVKWTSTPPGDR